MNILIKGMEMPANCFLCPLSVLNGDRLFCEVTKDEVIRAKRSICCPLVPVPKHGRLIKSAELYGKAEDIKTKALSVCDKPQSWQFGVFWAVEQIEAALTNAPTIIPAEESKR